MEGVQMGETVAAEVETVAVAELVELQVGQEAV